MSLVAQDLRYVAGGRELLRGVSLRVAPGEVHAILGPNGAGKSTLLRLLAGELMPSSGEVALNGRRLAEWNRAALARHRAVLPQGESLRFSFTANEVVALGRMPALHGSAAHETQIIAQALARADATHLAERLYPTLSGGEKSRVQFARVLAQVWEAPEGAPRALLLDEPTASLDLKHQHDCLRAARAFAQEGVAVVAILHDPNLALRYADTVSLLVKGLCVAQGETAAVLTPEQLEPVYGLKLARVTVAGRSQLVVSEDRDDGIHR